MTWPCIVALALASLLVPVCIRILCHAWECERKLNEHATRLITLELWKEQQCRHKPNP